MPGREEVSDVGEQSDTMAGGPTTTPPTERREVITPEAVLGRGTRDAVALLAVWLLRRSAWALLSLSVIVVILTGTVDSPDDLDPQVRSVADARQALRSPTTLLLLAAPAVRIVSSWSALALAFPHARALQQHADRGLGRGPLHPVAWIDRRRLASALREWRWTSSVRRLARQRLGGVGRLVLVADVLLVVAGVALFPVALVVLVTNLS